MTVQNSFQYPRRRWVRGPIKVMGRGLTRLLTRLTITGKENFPAQGPLIVVGNHVAMLEAALMVLYTPYNLELLAAGEIPLGATVTLLSRRRSCLRRHNSTTRRRPGGSTRC